MAKKFFKRGLSVLLATLMCIGTMSIMASAASTHSEATHLLGDAEGDLTTFNFKVVDEYIPAEGQKSYSVVGSGEQTEFWTAYLYTSPSEENPTEAPMATINGQNYYLRSGGRDINGIYLDGKFYPEAEISPNKNLQAAYNGLQQALLMNGDDKKVAVYCADHVTPTTTEALYNVVNIEDGTHYDEATAGKIRAVAVNGYWGGVDTVDQYGTLEKMEAMMRAAVDANGKRVFTDAEIDLLSPGVALSATQFAIWELANEDDDRQVVNVQYIQKNRVAGYNGKTWNTLKLTPEAEVPCVDLIFKLSNYLVNLDPVSVVDPTTANTILNYKNILQDVEIEVQRKNILHKNNWDTNKDNDAFVTNVTFDMLQVSDKDNLVAKIVDEAGNVYATGRIAGAKQAGEVALKNNGDGTYTFSNVTLIENKETTYTVVVEGVQYLERNVYLYFAGDRETSQTLIGYDEGEFTVDVTSSVKKTFSVNDIVIHKVDEQGKAVSGAEFALYAVTEDGDKLIGEYKVNKRGEIEIKNLEAGTYKLVETETPKGYIGVTEPMYFEIVETEDGDGFEVKHVFDEFEIEFPATAYEISNHITDVAIPQTFVLLDAEDAGNWTYSDEYTFGESDYRVVYCGDSTTGVEDGTRYTKTALEDCFDEATANRLRAIIANSYPYVSMEEMIAAAEAAGVADAANLTRGDIIAAVQQAIWHYTNGIADYTYKATYSVNNYPKWGLVFHDYSDELPDTLPKDTTAKVVDTASDARIRALYNYLLDLDPMTAAESEINTFFYTAVGGKDVSQSLIGGDRTDFYADGLNIYVKNFSDEPECPKPEKPECPKPEKPECPKPEKPECPKPDKPGCGEKPDCKPDCTQDENCTCECPDCNCTEPSDATGYEVKTDAYVEYDSTGATTGEYLTESEKTIEDGVTLSKTIEQTGENEFDITLQVTTTEDLEKIKVAKDAAVVIVMDVSGSMQFDMSGGGYCTTCGKYKTDAYSTCHGGWNNTWAQHEKLDALGVTPEYGETRFTLMEEAVSNFLADFADTSGADATRMVSMVCYNDKVEAELDWVDITETAGMDAAQAVVAPGALAALTGGDTNTSLGLQRANEYLANLTEEVDNTYVILLTDGAPYTAIQYNADGTYKNASGVGYDCDLTQIAADRLKAAHEGLEVYTICFGMQNKTWTATHSVVDGVLTGTDKTFNIDELMASIATDADHFFRGEDADQFSISMGDIVEETVGTAVKVWTVIDPMGDYIVYQGEESGDVFAFADNTLTWDLRADDPVNTEENEGVTYYTYELTYTISLDVEAEGFTFDTLYETNEATSLDYVITENGTYDPETDVKRDYFNVPTVIATEVTADDSECNCDCCKKPECNKPEKPNCGEKPQKPGCGEKPQKPGCGEKPEKPDCGEKPEKPDCGEKPQKPGCGEKQKPECDKPEWDDDFDCDDWFDKDDCDWDDDRDDCDWDND